MYCGSGNETTSVHSPHTSLIFDLKYDSTASLPEQCKTSSAGKFYERNKKIKKISLFHTLIARQFLLHAVQKRNTVDFVSDELLMRPG